MRECGGQEPDQESVSEWGARDGKCAEMPAAVLLRPETLSSTHRQARMNERDTDADASDGGSSGGSGR